MSTQMIPWDPEAMEAYRKSWRGKITRIGGRIERHIKWPRRVIGKIKNFVQRGRKGYGYQDLWSADQYMAGVIAGVLQSYAHVKHGVGHPYITGAESVDEAFEAMQKDYLKHAVIFEEYGKNGLAWDDNWKSEFGGVSEEEIKQSLIWLSEAWIGLWD